MVRPYITYKGFIAQQHPDVFNVFYNFLKEIRPARVLEIGTAGGGFILFIREALNSLGLHSSTIKSFDILCKPHYEILQNHQIDINIINLFNSEYTSLSFPNIIESYIQQSGVTLVLCDGGNKITEFNTISPIIKKGDFIMAHDYIDTKKNFNENFYEKIWNWCEIEEKDIRNISIQEQLKPYKQDIFSNVVWACRTK